MLVSFRARRVFYIHLCMPNTKRHQRWCLFVLGTLPPPRTHAEHEKTPLWCLFMLDAFIHVLTHAEHKKTPMLVSSCSAPVPGHLVSGKRGLPPWLSLFGTTKRPVPSSKLYLLLNYILNIFI